jgi:hypothetical protein
MPNLVADAKRMEDFPLASFLVKLKKALGLKQIENSFGDSHFAIAGGGFPVGSGVFINHLFEKQRALVGHALLVLATENVVVCRIIYYYYLYCKIVLRQVFLRVGRKTQRFVGNGGLHHRVDYCEIQSSWLVSLLLGVVLCSSA